MAKPILVTGTHRSASTWVGRLLAIPREVHYIQEPLNVTSRPSWLRHPPDKWYQFLPPEDDAWSDIARAVSLRFPLIYGLGRARSLRMVGSVLRQTYNASRARRQNRIPLVKDPFMVFNSPTFTSLFDGFTVFTVRHPGAFASSLRRLNWEFDFAQLSSQPELMDGPIAPWSEEIVRATHIHLPILDQACLLWRVVNGAIHEMAQQNPKSIVLVHERFAPQATSRLPELYERLDLPWNDGIASRILPLTSTQRGRDVGLSEVNVLERDSAATASVWRTRLTPDEIRRVEELSMPELSLFYD